MSVCYDTWLTIKGKKEELINILKYLNNYNKNNEKIYFDCMEAEFETKRLPKEFKKKFYIDNNIKDEEIEKNLSKLNDNKEYDVYIRANGPYGRFATVEEINFFKEITDISQDITFNGAIVGGEYIPEDRLEVKYSNKKLYSKCFLYSEDYNDNYIEEIKKILPYNKFCELFKIDESKFDESDYASFIWNEFGICDFPYAYTYNSFIENYDASEISREEYQEAIKEIEKLNLEDVSEFFNKRKEYWSLFEYNPATKKYKENGKSVTILNDKEETLKAIKSKKLPLSKVSDDLLKDKEFVLEVVKVYDFALEVVSQELRADKEVILEAVKKNGLSLQYASEELRADKEVVLEAVKKSGLSLEYASEELRADKEVVRIAAIQDVFALEYASNDLLNDKELILAVVKVWAYALVYASRELQNDKEFILEAVKRNRIALEYASEKFQKDKDILKIVNEKGN